MKARVSSFEQGKIPATDIGELKTDTMDYSGKILNGKAHGNGKLVYTSGPNTGDRYEG